MVQDHHPLGPGGLVHVMGDEHHGDAQTPVQVGDDLHDLLPAPRVQHGGGLVQNDAFRPHGDDSGDGHPLLLSAGEQMGGVLPVLVHPHLLQGLVHPAANLLGGDAQILRGEGHILLHHVCHNLIVRVLKHHAHGAADGNQVLLLPGVHAEHGHRPPLGQDDGVAVLGQGGFAAPVPAQHRHKGPLLHRQIQIPKHRNPGAAFCLRVCICQVLCLDRFCHNASCRLPAGLFSWSKFPSGPRRTHHGPAGACSTPVLPARRGAGDRLRAPAPTGPSRRRAASGPRRSQAGPARRIGSGRRTGGRTRNPPNRPPPRGPGPWCKS